MLKDTYISQYFVNIHSSVSHIGKTSNNTLVLSLITLRSDYFCFTPLLKGPSVKKTLKQLASVDLFHLKVLIADFSLSEYFNGGLNLCKSLINCNLEPITCVNTQSYASFFLLLKMFTPKKITKKRNEYF